MSKLKSMCLVSVLHVFQVFGSHDHTLGEKRLISDGSGGVRKRQRCSTGNPTVHPQTPIPIPPSDIMGADSQPDPSPVPICDLDPTALGMGMLCRRVIYSIYHEFGTIPKDPEYADKVESWTMAQIKSMYFHYDLGHKENIYDSLTSLKSIGDACAHHDTGEQYVGNLEETYRKIADTLDQISRDAADASNHLEEEDRDVLEDILKDFRVHIRRSTELANMDHNRLIRDLESENADLKAEVVSLRRQLDSIGCSIATIAREETRKFRTEIYEFKRSEPNLSKLE